ncbi:MAG: PH domain-containing protein [Acidimicrobiia bacterium]
MAFPPRLLNEGEELVLDLRPHWWYMSGPAAALVGSVLFGIVVYDRFDVLRWPAAALIVFCVVWFLVRYSKWVTTNFVVTGDRVVFRQGVIAKQGVEIPLERINTVFFNQTIFERMLGAGDLGIESAGERGSETFSDVRRPSAVQNEIYRQMERNNDRMYGRVRQANQPAPTEPVVDIPAQLERLDDLRRRGVISEQEFAAKKAQLLERM